VAAAPAAGNATMLHMRYWFLNPTAPAITLCKRDESIILATNLRKKSRPKKLLPL
jgi:hypothetical protein